jgi:hypothetical protein
MEETILSFGIDGDLGTPIIPKIYKNEIISHLTNRFLKYHSEIMNADEIYFGLFDDYHNDLNNPEQMRWGLIVNKQSRDKYSSLLHELINFRNGEILLYDGEDPLFWKEFYGADEINPEKIPYYLLIAGSPAEIPFELQFSLDGIQAVGRIDFENDKDYEVYANKIVSYEKTSKSKKKHMLFFAPDHDDATHISSTILGKELSSEIEKEKLTTSVTKLLRRNATKENLLRQLENNSKNQSTIFLSASHGLAFSDKDEWKKKVFQGAIRCQDYESPLNPNTRKGTISSLDVQEGFLIKRGIVFIFACYGAGTFAKSDFVNYLPREYTMNLIKAQGKISFTSSLPKSLLSDPEGALAIIGHVDPTLTYTFQSPEFKETKLKPYAICLNRLLQSEPIGYALNIFNEKAKNLSHDLALILNSINKNPSEQLSEKMLKYWISRNDMNNLIILGDPAARIN